MGQHILVTGATGFLGNHLVKRLLMDGHRVSAMVRNPVRLTAQNPDCLPLTMNAPLGDIHAVDVVINLSGESLFSNYWTYSRKQKIRSSRVAFTLDLATRLKLSGHSPHTMLSGSAIGYYGFSETARFNEADESGEDFGARLCHDWEHVALKMATRKTRCVLLRTGIVLHPEGGALKQMLPPFKLGLGGKIATGRQGMSWIHLTDYIDALLHCLHNKELSGPVNLCAPNPASNQEFADTLAKVLHRPKVFDMPAWLLSLLLGERADMLIHGQYVLPKKLLASGFQFQYPELQKALDSLLFER